LILLAAGVFASASSASADSGKNEVASKFKTERVAQLNMAAYEDELLDCSALAGIHTWIGDNLGDGAGAEVRMALAEDYWISVSKRYLELAEQAGGEADLEQQLGPRMRELAAEFRDLTSSQSAEANWTDWYDLIDRCDSWRPAKPTHAFYNNGREATAKPSRNVAAPAG
jgi:hypothetical protein